MANEAYKLQVSQMDNRLWVSLVCQIHHDKFSIVKCKSLVYHDWVIKLNSLSGWMQDSWLIKVIRLGPEETKPLSCDFDQI